MVMCGCHSKLGGPDAPYKKKMMDEHFTKVGETLKSFLEKIPKHKSESDYEKLESRLYRLEQVVG